VLILQPEIYKEIKKEKKKEIKLKPNQKKKNQDNLKYFHIRF
jgi:hypothetical protein